MSLYTFQNKIQKYYHSKEKENYQIMIIITLVEELEISPGTCDDAQIWDLWDEEMKHRGRHISPCEIVSPHSNIHIISSDKIKLKIGNYEMMLIKRNDWLNSYIFPRSPWTLTATDT